MLFLLLDCRGDWDTYVADPREIFYSFVQLIVTSIYLIFLNFLFSMDSIKYIVE